MRAGDHCSRDWERAQRWRSAHAQTGDAALHISQLRVEGRIDLRGYLGREGRFAEIVSADIDFTADVQFRQSRISAAAHDTLGRACRLEGTYVAHFLLSPVPSCTLVEGAMACEIDGESGRGCSEFMWSTAYLEGLRDGPRY